MKFLAILALVAVSSHINESQAIRISKAEVKNHHARSEEADLDNIMKVVDHDGNGKISKRELVSQFERLAKLVSYTLTDEDLGHLGYLWSVMDIEGQGELEYD